MSLINTMCPSSLCTWETFIRSRLLRAKTAPHAGLSLFEIDQNRVCQLYCSWAWESSLLLWGSLYYTWCKPHTHTHTHSHTPLDVSWFGEVGYCFLLGADALAGGNGSGPDWRQLQIWSAWLRTESSVFHMRLAPSVNPASKCHYMPLWFN